MALKSAECWYAIHESNPDAHSMCEDEPAFDGVGCQCTCHIERQPSVTDWQHVKQLEQRVMEYKADVDSLRDQIHGWALRADKLDQLVKALEERIKVLEQTGKPRMGMAVDR